MALYKDSIGVKIYVYLGVNVSGAGTVSLHVIQPDGVAVTWSATKYDAEGGLVLHTTVDGDLDQLGQYTLHGVWKPTPEEVLYGDAATFSVLALGS